MYKTKVKQSPGWDSYNRCIISISQGQECHNGDKLDALLYWGIENHEECILNISDTLHRHNLIRNGMDRDKAYLKSFAMGNEWAIQNKAILDKHRACLKQIHRWNDWLYHHDFDDVHHGVIKYFNECDAFRNTALSDVERFVERKENQQEGSAIEIKFNNSLDYLLEETAAYIIMSRHYQANRVYPAKALNTFEYLRKTSDLPEIIKGMEQSMHVRVIFKRIKNDELLEKAA